MLRKRSCVWGQHHTFTAVVIFFVVALSDLCVGQSYLDATGSPTFAMNVPVEMGFINAANGNVHLEISLGNFPQRGTLTYAPRFVYDSRIWKIEDTGTSKSWQPTNVPNSQGGWRFVTGAEAGTVTYGSYVATCRIWDEEIGGWGYVPYHSYRGFSWTDPGGTKHAFSAFTSSGEACGRERPSDSGLSTDASGYLIKITNYTSAEVYAPDGTRVYPSLKDRNGNYFSTDANGNVKDTLNRVPVEKSTQDPNTTVFTVHGYNNSSWQVTVATQSKTIATAFGQAGVTENSQPLTVVSSIQIGNLGTYTFGYDSYGELTSIQLPTGGIITYEHSNFTDPAGNVSRWVWKHQIGSDPPLKVEPAIDSGGNKVTVRQPNNDYTQYTFALNNGAWSTAVVSYNASGGLVSSAVNVWDLSNSCGTDCTGAGYVKKQSSTVYVGSRATKTEYYYSSTQLPNVNAIKQWDFGNSGSTPSRETNITYVTDAAYTARNIVSLPLSVIVKNAGVQTGQTDFAYDQSSLVSAPGAPGHDDTNYGTGFTVRGNAMTISRKASSTKTISTAVTYDMLGNLRTSSDPLLHSTEYRYSDDGGCLTNTILPTTGGVAHEISYACDSSTGLQTSVTDENSQQTTYNYDASGRLVSVTYPAGGGRVDYDYSDLKRPEATRQTNASTTRSEFSLIDDFGRLVRTARQNANGGYDVQDVCYDVNGRRNFLAYPYLAASYTGTQVCSGAGDTYAFDAAGRIQQISHSDGSAVNYEYSGAARKITEESNGSARRSRVFQSNAFGDLVSVCEVISTPVHNENPVACGQDIAATGFLTSYSNTYTNFETTFTVTQGVQTRTFKYDGLSRLTSMTDPESGTTTYTYNDDGTVATRIRPKQNQILSDTVTTFFEYDELSRLKRVSYNDSLTPELNNVYDASSIDGLTISNPKGRLVKSYTSAASSFYGYNEMGRVKNNWQQVSTRRGLTYDYDYEGNVINFNNGMGSVFDYSYGLDGRPKELKRTVGGVQSTLFTADPSNPYNALGELLKATLGNGVIRALAYNDHGMVLSQIDRSPTLPADHSTGYVDLAGQVQMKLTGGTGGAPGTGTVTISGSEHSFIPDPPCDGGLRASGNATQGVVSPQSPVCPRVYDSGTVTVTVNGFPVSVFYSRYSTTQTIASAIASGFNVSASPVNATVSANVITLTAKTIGVSTNYPVSTSSATDYPAYLSPSFSATPPAGGHLSGGADLINQIPLYDQGTVAVTVGMATKTANYGQNSTPTTIATDLAGQFAGTIVNANPSGSRVNFTSVAGGSTTNYPISVSTTWDSTNFTNGSFSGTTSGATMTGGADEGSVYKYALARAGNGNVTGADDSVNGVWSYGYDPLGRLLNAFNGTVWLDWNIDRYGNRWNQNGGGYATQLTINAWNRIVGYTYDAAGNVIDDSFYKYVYDAEGRMLNVKDLGGSVIASYTYSPEGLRVKVTKGADVREYVYDLAGREVGELNGGNASRTEIYLGGAHLAVETNSTMYYLHPDWLGTVRKVSSASNINEGACSSLPYGDGVNCTGAAPLRHMFTDYVRDTESNLEHSWFRQYSSRVGRYHAPDALLGGTDDPQTWNRYAYVLNSPMSAIDPLGRNMASDWCNGFSAEYVCNSWDDYGWSWGLGGGGGWGGFGGGGRSGWGGFGFFPGENSINFPGPSLLQSLWEDVLGLPHMPTMGEIVNPVSQQRPTPLGPSGCSYYDEECKKGDAYSCKAGGCCRTFPDTSQSNQVRGCLIAYDRKFCSTKTGTEKDECRFEAHLACYSSNLFAPIPKLYVEWKENGKCWQILK